MDELGSSRTSRRTFVVLAGMVVLVLVAAAAIAAVARSVARHHPRQHVVHGKVARVQIVAQPVPAPPAGFPASEFRMAAPIFLPDMGGPTAQARGCRVDEIHATTGARRTTGGVLGVLRLTGTATVKDRFGHKESCSLHVRPGSIRLLAADGAPLRLGHASGDPTSPPANQRSDIPLSAGDAVLGFDWYGSYCGPQASAVAIRLRHGATVQAQFRGPQPACAAGRNRSVLVDGVVGSPGEPVQSARPDYARLRPSARAEPGTTGDELAPIKLTLRTTSSTPIALDPCPAYGGMFQGQADSGGFAADLRARGYLPCTRHTVVIAVGRPLTFTIPASDLFETAEKGSTIKLRIGIAGVPEVQLAVTAH